MNLCGIDYAKVNFDYNHTKPLTKKPSLRYLSHAKLSSIN
jgi:hypothetical protein